MRDESATTARRGTVIGIGVASALVPLNSTMVAVALPKIAHSFHIAKGHAAILITVYLVAMLVIQPISGRISDVVGNKQAAVVSLTGFAICSFVAALAPTFAVLVIARGVQAVFASALAPSTQSMLRSVTQASDRGHVFGLLGSMIGVGAAAGPLVGGVLIGLFGWQAIFLFNVPVVLIAFVLLLRVSVPTTTQPNPFQPALLGAPERLWTRTYVAAFGTQALSNLAQYSLLLVTPIVLDERGWGSAEIGLALSALTIGLIVMGPSGGRLGDRVGRRRPVMVGMAVALLGILLVAPFGARVSPTVLILALGLFGVGLGFAAPSIMTAGIEAVPERRTGLAAGLLSTSRYLGSIAASLVLAGFVNDDASGSHVMFVAAAIALLLSIGSASRLPSSQVRGRVNVAA